jgi:hypothetical protein
MLTQEQFFVSYSPSSYSSATSSSLSNGRGRMIPLLLLLFGQRFAGGTNPGSAHDVTCWFQTVYRGHSNGHPRFGPQQMKKLVALAASATKTGYDS